MDQAEVIYLEGDAEITEAIDKLKGAKTSAVKIVVPARSSLLQSAVNLKLLKKSAKDHNKELALVTNDKTATYLAAGVGLAVAKNVNAEPVIPQAIAQEIEPDIVEQKQLEEVSGDQPLSKAQSNESTPQAKEKPSKPVKGAANEEAPIMASRALADGDDLGEGAPPAHAKSPKVPDYSSFQKRLWLIAGAIAVVVLLIAGVIVLPSANVTVLAQANKLGLNTKFILDSSTTQNDPGSLTYAAQTLELDKNLTQAFTATGQQDAGSKATGTVTLSNASSSTPITLPAGTVLTASQLNFTLDNATTVPGAGVSNFHIVPGQTTATITASANGSNYNLGTTNFTVTNSSVTASGSTSGGVTKTVQVVTQGDIDQAAQQALSSDTAGSKQTLFAKVDKNSYLFEGTFAATPGTVSSSAPAGSQNSGGTVTFKAAYTVLVASNATLNSLLTTQAKSLLPSGDQQLYQDGLQGAKFTLVKTLDANQTQFSVSTTAYYGKKIDTTQIAKDTAGKSKQDVTSIIQKDDPGVTSAEVDEQPALFPSMPFLSGHIKVQIKVSTD